MASTGAGFLGLLGAGYADKRARLFAPRYLLVRQKHEERKRAELEKFAEYQGRQLRNLQEKRNQLKTYLAATIEETLANRESSD